MSLRRLTMPAALGLLAACSPGTRRPAFGPVPESRTAALEVTIPDATRRLAEALKAAGIPVTRIELRDGYVESAWFDTAGMQPVSRRPLGAGVVRVRGWVDPSEYGFSQMTVEAVYRRAADPSVPARELERAVPYDHPARRRLREALASMGARAVGSEPDAPRPVVAAAPRAAADSAGPPVEKGRRAAEAPPAKPRRGAPAAARSDSVPRDTAPREAAPRDTTARDTTASDSVRAPAARPPAPTPAPPRRTPAPTPPATGGFAVQVAAAATPAEAEAIAARLRTYGETPRIVSEGGLHKVRTAGYATRAAANARLARLRGAFAGAFVVAPR